jgi:hypothetical protein
VTLYPYHWLTSGLDEEIQTVIEGARVFAPIRLNNGTNVGVYTPSRIGWWPPVMCGRRRSRCSPNART